MGKILTMDEIESASQKNREQKKKIVLVGGSFDILHVGHILFLEAAKNAGDILFVEVESDERIRRLKGKSRPINSQSDRVCVLSHLNMVDYVIPLPANLSDQDYLTITKKVQPAILATTKGDPKNVHLTRQAKILGIEMKEVVNLIPGKSTSELAKTLGFD